jgi:hypothetical protein
LALKEVYYAVDGLSDVMIITHPFAWSGEAGAQG